MKKIYSKQVGNTGYKKYGNIKTMFNDIEFDSRAERDRYCLLLDQLYKKTIKDLRRQVVYQCIVNNQLICKYIADFVYVISATDTLIVEDVKSPVLEKDPLWRLKSKLMAACHGIQVKIVSPDLVYTAGCEFDSNRENWP